MTNLPRHTETDSPTVARRAIETGVCVVGGGMAGICAAVAAARSGAKTVLVHDRPMLGGNASSEIRVPIGGAYGEPLPGGGILENREGGIIEEILCENVFRNPTCIWQVWDHHLWNFCTREPNLTVLLNTAIQECGTDGARIVSVTGWDSIAYTRVTVFAQVFIDCSGDGILRLSGAEWTSGREGRGQFGESYAPDEPNATVMGATLNVFAEPTGIVEERAGAPETAADYPMPVSDRDAYGKRDIAWTCGALEWGGEKDTIRDADEIRDRLFRWSHGYWEKVKREALRDGRDSNGRLWERTFLSSLPGKRESVRYVGDHVLTQNDLLSEGRDFPDNIGHGGWPMDDHFSEGFFSQRGQTVFNKCPKVYGIPYRCLYSRNVANLMFAGRDVSVSHMALSSTRVMATCSVMGQAAGTAAAIAVREGTTPRGVGERHIVELQDTLQWNDQFIPWRNRKITALSLEGRLSHDILRDGMDRIRLDGEHGVWLKPGEATEYSFDGERRFQGVRLVVDTDMSDNRWQRQWMVAKKARRLPDAMPRDFDVQVRSGGAWGTVREVRDNFRRFLDIRFAEPVAGDVCRIVWKCPWGETTDQRVFSFEVY